MKTQQKTIVIVCGFAALGTLGYAGYQMMALLAPPKVRVTQDTSAVKPEARASSKPTTLPTLSQDPFLELPTAQIVAGPSTTGSESTPVTSPGVPLQGGIAPAPVGGRLPSVQPDSNGPTQAGADDMEGASPNGEQEAEAPPTLALRGVMEAGELQAFLSVHGKRAKPFVVGEEVILGARITNIQPNFIELNVLGKTIRLRVGQEVNFS